MNANFKALADPELYVRIYLEDIIVSVHKDMKVMRIMEAVSTSTSVFSIHVVPMLFVLMSLVNIDAPVLQGITAILTHLAQVCSITNFFYIPSISCFLR